VVVTALAATAVARVWLAEPLLPDAADPV